MKKNIALLLLVFISIQSSAEENICEKIWKNQQDNIEIIKIEKNNISCKHIWEDVNKLKILKIIGLNPKDSQWMSTGECQVLEVDKDKYQVYYAYLKNDHSDIRIINDINGNYFSYFRNLGHYDLFEDKFFPTEKANKNGVELSCPGLGDFDKLKSILNLYLINKKIDVNDFSFEDLNK